LTPNLCITVVEDNESLCAVTVELLCQQGHRAVGVTSAEALGDEQAGALIDVLLVDLNLPGEDGFSLVRRYRAACPDLRIIVVSSRDRVEDRLACYQAGADAFIAKPTNADELLAIVQAHARRLTVAGGEPRPEPPSTTPHARLDMRRGSVTGPLGTVAISVGAAMILSALALAPGQRLEHWQLIEALGEDAAHYTMAALGVRMVRLRHLLREVGFEGDTVRAMRSAGYQLCVPMLVV
jgi:DNA-binding response OmpR family regulator